MKNIFFLFIASLIFCNCTPKQKTQNLAGQLSEPVNAQDQARDVLLAKMSDEERSTALDKLLEKDTMVFETKFDFEYLIKVVGIAKGNIKLRRWPKGEFDHYIMISSDSIEYNLDDIQAKKYMMDLRYGFENGKKDYKRIYKPIKTKWMSETLIKSSDIHLKNN